MSAQAKEQGSFDRIAPGSVDKDELDEFIRYQDKILDRNAKELRGMVEDQERQIRERMEYEEQRTEELYTKEDFLDSLDIKIRSNIDRIDTNLADRTRILDKKTDDYMDDLGRRNAEWSHRLRSVGTTITKNSRTKNVEGWKERMEQKRLNREYIGNYTQVEEDEAWDEGLEVIEEESVIRDQRTEVAVEVVEEPGPAPRKKQKKKQAKQPRYKTSVSTPATAVTRQQARRQVPTAKARSVGTTTTMASHKTYPCPGCQKDLIYYEKYKRWWCRSCKKWR